MTYKKIIIGLIISSILDIECVPSSQSLRETQKQTIIECQNQYSYLDYHGQGNMTVLLVSRKFSADLTTYPNFIIGQIDNDTIGFLDKDFNGDIDVGDALLISEFSWSDDEKKIYKLPVTIQNSQKLNDLYCKIDFVYYGKIEQK